MNNSNLIKEKISFIYAISDDFFTDKKERVKFFEYMIPIIPFINYSNAEEQLKKLIKDSGLQENIFSDDFISDITPFIDDIDMRLLVNIFQEFLVYKDIVGKINPVNEQLFAIITYKNIAPEDFNKLVNDVQIEKDNASLRVEKALILALELQEYEEYILNYNIDSL